jgi:putative addiction module component (TIGR02574 family)
MSSAKTIISKALHLKPAERSIVIETLIKSLDMPNPKIDKVWTKEAEKRLDAYKAGKLKTVSLETLFGKSS